MYHPARTFCARGRKAQHNALHVYHPSAYLVQVGSGARCSAAFLLLAFCLMVYLYKCPTCSPWGHVYLITTSLRGERTTLIAARERLWMLVPQKQFLAPRPQQAKQNAALVTTTTTSPKHDYNDASGVAVASSNTVGSLVAPEASSTRTPNSKKDQLSVVHGNFRAQYIKPTAHQAVRTTTRRPTRALKHHRRNNLLLTLMYYAAIGGVLHIHCCCMIQDGRRPQNADNDRNAPPPYDPAWTNYSYEMWAREITTWMIADERDPRRKAAAIVRNLRGEAYNLAHSYPPLRR